MSSDVVAEMGEYARCVTTAANAYVQPLMTTYLRRLQHALRGLAHALYLPVQPQHQLVMLGRLVQQTAELFGIDGRFAGYLRYDKDLWQRFGQGQPEVAGAVSFLLHQGMAEVLDSVLNAVRAAEA